MSEKAMYVVTSGCYSGYGVVAIFDDAELAKAYVGDSDDSDGYGMRVEEYLLNPGADRIRAGLRTHTIKLLRNGDVYEHFERFSDDPEAGRVAYHLTSLDSRPTSWRRVYHFEAVIIAKTKEQAIKAANERRARYLAEGGEWPENE